MCNAAVAARCHSEVSHTTDGEDWLVRTIADARLGVCDCAVVSQAMDCKRPARNIQCANVCAVAVGTEPRRALAHDQIVLDDEHASTGAVNKKRVKSVNDGIAPMVSVGHQMVDASEDVQVPLSEKAFTQWICDYESV